MIAWLIEAVSNLLLSALSLLSNELITVLGFNFVQFDKWFGITLKNGANFLNEAYMVINSFAFSLVIIISLFQFLKTFGLPIGVEAESPLIIICRGVATIMGIVVSKPMFNLMFEVFKPVFDAFLDIDAGGFSLIGSPDAGGLVLSTIFSNVATFQLIVFVVFMVIIFYNYIKYMLELLERYLMMCFVAYTAPLAICTFTSKSTSNIFSTWFRMAFTQYIVYIINIFGLKMFIVMAANVNFTELFSTNIANFIIQVFAVVAFIKLLQKLDSLLGKLGLEVGNAGGDILGEILAARETVSAMTGGGGGKSSGGGIASKVAGAASGGIFDKVTKGLGGLAGNISSSIFDKGKKATAMAFAGQLGSKLASPTVFSNSAKAFKSGYGESKNIVGGLKSAGKQVLSNTVLGKGIVSAAGGINQVKYNKGIRETGFGKIQNSKDGKELGTEQKDLMKSMNTYKNKEGGLSEFANGFTRPITDDKIGDEFFNSIMEGQNEVVATEYKYGNIMDDCQTALSSGLYERTYSPKKPEDGGQKVTYRVATNPQQMANERKRAASNPNIQLNEVKNFHTGKAGAVFTRQVETIPPKPKFNKNSNPEPEPKFEGFDDEPIEEPEYGEQ